MVDFTKMSSEIYEGSHTSCESPVELSMGSIGSNMPGGACVAGAGIAVSLADLFAISASGPESLSDAPLKSTLSQRGAAALMLLVPGRDGVSDIGSRLGGGVGVLEKLGDGDVA